MTADETRTVSLDGETPAILLYEGNAGEVITISAHSLESDAEEAAVRDMVLEVLSPDGERLAYNDNHRTERADLLPDDSLIHKLILPETGTYEIRVNTYGGIFPGEVEVRLTADHLYEAEFSEGDEGNLTINALLPAQRQYTYTFEAAEGEILQISARDTSYTLDPVLWLVEAEGEVIAFNDDHGTDSLALDALDAQLTDVPITTTGRYTLIISDFIGAAGGFELIIQRR